MDDSPLPSSSETIGGVGRPRPTTSAAVAPDLPERAHLHRLRKIFPRDPLCFLTCCTAQRGPLLAQPESAAIVIEAFHASPTFHGWSIGRYVLMPDHVHFFARPREDAKPLSAFIRDWKKWTAKQIAQKLNATPPVWQPEFFDHVLRSPESYSEKLDYVRQNPVRAGLADTPDAWPFAGECEPLSF